MSIPPLSSIVVSSSSEAISCTTSSDRVPRGDNNVVINGSNIVSREGVAKARVSKIEWSVFFCERDGDIEWS